MLTLTVNSPIESLNIDANRSAYCEWSLIMRLLPVDLSRKPLSHDDFQHAVLARNVRLQVQQQIIASQCIQVKVVHVYPHSSNLYNYVGWLKILHLQQHVPRHVWEILENTQQANKKVSGHNS